MGLVDFTFRFCDCCLRKVSGQLFLPQ
uniref:Uncharacterized protein n=1 Tax=Anguilla anguilla TaxID=7936 RepID=A0A0E9RST2_ANGAN